MPELVRLPSGLSLELEAPNVRGLLYDAMARRDGIDARRLAASCMGRSALSADRLDEEDAFCAASWAAAHLSDDAEAIDLAALGEYYGQAPSARLHITDTVLAFELDCALTLALSQAREEARDEGAQEAAGFRKSAPATGVWFPHEKTEVSA